MDNLRSNELAWALEAEDSLMDRGFSVSCGGGGEVVVARWNHVRGVWSPDGSDFIWTPAGYGVPSFRAESLEEAVARTVMVIAKN